MDESSYRKWDIGLKIVGYLVLLPGALFTLYKYAEDRKAQSQQEEADRIKVQRSFIFERQANVYFDLSKTAATLATSKDGAALREARAKFWQLYYGELRLVEDRRVELTTISFERCLEKDKGSNGPCERLTDERHSLKTEELQGVEPTLEELSLEISACARQSLEESWGVQFDPVGLRSLEKPVTSCPYK